MYDDVIDLLHLKSAFSQRKVLMLLLLEQAQGKEKVVELAVKKQSWLVNWANRQA